MAGTGHVRATEKVIAVNEDEELRRRGFNVGATLGEGSYAKVKCAFWNEINRRVAIKIINKKKAPKDFQTRFLPRELDIMKRVKHPNIIELFEILPLNGKVYLIMEMAGHGDLLEYIKLRGAIPEEKAKGMYMQLAFAISYLHHKDIVHRDLKCENVLLDVKNQIKVSDFGFARRMEGGELSSTFCGSAAYAAPEILQGIPYTGKCYDVWSLGVILYIMVGGSMPYDDSNIKKMIRYQTERKVGFSKSRALSNEVKYLIHHMLEAKVPSRFSIDQVIQSPWLDSVRPAIEATLPDHVHEDLKREQEREITPMDIDKACEQNWLEQVKKREERKAARGGRESPCKMTWPPCDNQSRCRDENGNDICPLSPNPDVKPLSNMVAHQEPRDRVWRTDNN